MRLQTYTSTAGLERFPASERYRAWRRIHDRLMIEDSEYRRRVKRYLRRVAVGSVVYCGGLSVPVFVTSLTLKSSVSMLSGWGTCTVAFLMFILWNSFGLQEYENERIAKELGKGAYQSPEPPLALAVPLSRFMS